ncbi:MAG: hypothetical protein QXY52_01420 [Conexivisphaerales archaeon]
MIILWSRRDCKNGKSEDKYMDLLQNFDSAEQMISAIPEEYRWDKDHT